ncbi:DUF7577 domain-containing protein [Natrinema salinisoli]|nr:hypothetical protein [Natrinema salinisoli]
MGTRTRTIDEPVTCRACGTENEHSYTYCRHCLGQLPARPDSSR